jgi:hypothetical protein
VVQVAASGPGGGSVDFDGPAFRSGLTCGAGSAVRAFCRSKADLVGPALVLGFRELASRGYRSFMYLNVIMHKQPDSLRKKS